MKTNKQEILSWMMGIILALGWVLAPAVEQAGPEPAKNKTAAAPAKKTAASSDKTSTPTQAVTARRAVKPKAPLSEKDKIEALLKFVEKSDTTFIRGGTEYTPAKAAEHLRMKLGHSHGRVKTARQFIDYIAAKSSMTGEPYYVRSKNGTRITTAVWLNKALAEIEIVK